jgi:hypothetical protein
VLDTQCRPILLDGDQAVDIGVSARVDPGILGMLGEDFQAFPCGLAVDRAEGLRQMVIDRQRTLAARLVLDGGNDIAVGVEQVDSCEVGNSREFF